MRRFIGVSLTWGTILLQATPLAAQTRFEWPDTTTRLADYTTIESCLALTNRAWQGVKHQRALKVINDTMPVDLTRNLQPAPAAITDVAARCAKAFTVGSIDLDHLVAGQVLLLAAGRDSDAAMLVNRGIAAIPESKVHGRAAVMDTAFQMYLRAQPARVAVAEAMTQRLAKMTTDRVKRLWYYTDLFVNMRFVGDTVRTLRTARAMLALGDSLTPADRQSDAFVTFYHDVPADGMLFEALREIRGWPAELDSLRHGTAALAALMHADWVRVNGHADTNEFPIGHRALPITADYWFPADSGVATPPAPPTLGRVSLIAYLPADCSGNTSEILEEDWLGCVGRLVRLRRMRQRFPALEVTIVTQTRGAFMWLAPPPPVEEANWEHQWIDSYGVFGATLSVTATPFTNLPSPDGRRINSEHLPNIDHYTFGKVYQPGLVLVDPDGVIVSTAGLTEAQLDGYIDVLFHRTKAGS